MATVKINWMKGLGNAPRIELSGIRVPEHPSETDPIWEKLSNGLHVARKGVFVFYFYSNGKPTEGYGGRRFAGTFMDGTTFEYRGAGSSRAGCVNDAVHRGQFDSYIVDVTVGSCSCAVTASFLHALELPTLIEWVYKNWGSEPTLEPAYRGKLKGDDGFVFPE